MINTVTLQSSPQTGGILTVHRDPKYYVDRYGDTEIGFVAYIYDLIHDKVKHMNYIIRFSEYNENININNLTKIIRIEAIPVYGEHDLQVAEIFNQFGCSVTITDVKNNSKKQLSYNSLDGFMNSFDDLVGQLSYSTEEFMNINLEPLILQYANSNKDHAIN